jgi:molecular chaperone IbpA
MAVAGFSENELHVSVEPNLLVVPSEKAAEPQGEILHRGIANRAFARRFELADHVWVTGASLVNGMLIIDLRRELPEEMKPRRIEITTATRDTPQRIGHKRQAA